ncbi:MAG: hypothetical protein NZ773_15885 [Dehalococcoidia bacterium]|nr:hypothetical protein [Dehalococcoidia bacterium]
MVDQRVRIRVGDRALLLAQHAVRRNPTEMWLAASYLLQALLKPL